MQKPPKKPWKAYGRYGSLGIELIVSMAIGYYGGRWLDGQFGTRWLAGLGFLLGVYAGFRQIFRAAQRMQIISCGLQSHCATSSAPFSLRNVSGSSVSSVPKSDLSPKCMPAMTGRPVVGVP